MPSELTMQVDGAEVTFTIIPLSGQGMAGTGKMDPSRAFLRVTARQAGKEWSEEIPADGDFLKLIQNQLSKLEQMYRQARS